MTKLLYLLPSFLLVSLFSASIVASAGTAKLSLSPSTGVKNVGTNFDVEIRVNTGSEKINSAAGILTYPKDLVDVEISTLNSFANFFSQREVDAISGTVKVNGGVSEGITGDNLLLATLTLTPKKAGSANLAFTNQSVVYKGGLNVLGTSSGGVYTLSATPSGGLSTPVATASSTSALPKSGFTEFTLILVLLSLSSIVVGLTFKKLLA